MSEQQGAETEVQVETEELSVSAPCYLKPWRAELLRQIEEAMT